MPNCTHFVTYSCTYAPHQIDQAETVRFTRTKFPFVYLVTMLIRSFINDHAECDYKIFS